MQYAAKDRVAADRLQYIENTPHGRALVSANLDVERGWVVDVTYPAIGVDSFRVEIGVGENLDTVRKLETWIYDHYDTEFAIAVRKARRSRYAFRTSKFDVPVDENPD